MEKIQLLRQFVTRRVVWMLALGILASFVLFVIEYYFAFVLQTFFSVLGFASVDQLDAPAFLKGLGLHQVLMCIFVLGVSRTLMQSAQGVVQGVAQYDFAHLQRERILNWVFTQRAQNSGEVMSLFGDTIQMASFAVLSFQATFFQISTCIFLAASLLWLMPKITFIAFLVLGLTFPILRLTNKKNWEGGNLVSKHWSRISTRIMMSIKNLLLIRIYGIQREELTQAKADLKQVLSGQTKGVIRYSTVSIVPSTIGLGLLCGIVILTRADDTQQPAGLLISYFYIFFRFLQTVSTTVASQSRFFHFYPHFKKVMSWWTELKESTDLDAKPEAVSGVTDLDLNLPVGWSLNQVDFRYPNAKASVFNQLDLDILPGQALVILGESGVGKSTLLNLILGELQPQSGTVNLRVNDRQFPLLSVRSRVVRRFGYVGPEPFLFDGTIKENLLYGLGHTPTVPEIESALKLAECHFVHSLAEGLNHRITEQGEGLSAGQKQRLSLARALLRRPTALILDEATSNLDLQTENRLLETLKHLKGKMTLVIVTHRETLVGIADQVLRLGKSE